MEEENYQHDNATNGQMTKCQINRMRKINTTKNDHILSFASKLAGSLSNIALFEVRFYDTEIAVYGFQEHITQSGKLMKWLHNNLNKTRAHRSVLEYMEYTSFQVSPCHSLCVFKSKKLVVLTFLHHMYKLFHTDPYTLQTAEEW